MIRDPEADLQTVVAFYDRVCRRADETMVKTGRVEGAHFAAMKVELDLMRRARECDADEPEVLADGR